MVFSAICSRDGRERRKPPLRPQSSLVFSFFARATSSGRCTRNRSWPSITSGSRSLMSRGESSERVSFRFFYVARIDNDQFFPAGVVRQSDAHHVIVVAGVIPTRRDYSEHFELHAFQFLEGQILKQGASSCSEIMLNRIGKREEIAAGVLKSVAKRNQFLPAIDGDEPARTSGCPEVSPSRCQDRQRLSRPRQTGETARRR